MFVVVITTDDPDAFTAPRAVGPFDDYDAAQAFSLTLIEKWAQESALPPTATVVRVEEAYPGVVGVTAVDARLKVLIEAARGPQVMFAAPGADLATAASGGNGYQGARGTSFAAPLVAALLATQLATPAPWQPGDDAIIAGSVSDEQARERYPDAGESPLPYIRIVPTT